MLLSVVLVFLSLYDNDFIVSFAATLRVHMHALLGSGISWWGSVLSQ